MWQKELLLNGLFEKMEQGQVLGVLFCVLWVGQYYISAKELNWKKMDEECIKKLDLNKTLIETVSNELIIPENNTDLNNFLSCTWMKEGTQNENGEINWNKVEETFAKSLQEEFVELPTLDAIIAAGATASAIKLCKEDDIRGQTPGETIAKIQNCIIKRVFK